MECYTLLFKSELSIFAAGTLGVVLTQEAMCLFIFARLFLEIDNTLTPFIY